jgi:ABC-type phosphate transport system permease subunit
MGGRLRRNTPDGRAELMLGALSVGVLALIALMLVTVFLKAWPSFAHNGIKWFFPGGDVDQQLKAIITGPTDPAHYD